MNARGTGRTRHYGAPAAINADSFTKFDNRQEPREGNETGISIRKGGGFTLRLGRFPIDLDNDP